MGIAIPKMTTEEIAGHASKKVIPLDMSGITVQSLCLILLLIH